MGKDHPVLNAYTIPFSMLFQKMSYTVNLHINSITHYYFIPIHQSLQTFVIPTPTTKTRRLMPLFTPVAAILQMLECPDGNYFQSWSQSCKLLQISQRHHVYIIICNLFIFINGDLYINKWYIIKNFSLQMSSIFN